MSTNEKKSATLGMPHGTAVHKLRKKILFHLICKLKENSCFKCSKLIDSINDLSIEHKKPWEGVSADLFWNLDNIAFSHLRCNVPHSRPGGIGRRKIGGNDLSWCSSCRKFISKDLFYKDKGRWTGLGSRCKNCAEISKGRIGSAATAAVL